MDFYSEMLEMMKNGKSAEDIASQLSKDLERAEKEHKSSAEVRKKKARETFAKKYDTIMRDYLSEIGMDITNYTSANNESIGLALDLVEAGMKFTNSEKKNPVKITMKSTDKGEKKTDDDLISSFLRSFGI